MRLTLRTLLAYMDDILDPADQEELGRKIESSPFATELIHRSRDAVRRLRLSAPEVLGGDSEEVLDGGDHNLDANTAAEYLDNTLSPDAVADFERACLEAGPHADMLLAEAASCHHVLTMVLGEPAEVDADLRQRMYALLDAHAAQKLRIEPAHQSPLATAPLADAEHAAPTGAASLPSARQVDRDEADAPDYMLAAAKAERRSRRRMTLAALAAAVVCGLGVFVFWPAGEVETPSELAAMGKEEDLTEGVEMGAVTSSGESATTGDLAPSAESGGGEAPAFNAAAPTSEPSGEAPPFVAAPAGTTPGAPSTTDAPAAIEPAAEAVLDETAAAAAAAVATTEAATPPPEAPAPAASDPSTGTAIASGEAQTLPEAPMPVDGAPPGDAAATAAPAPPAEAGPALASGAAAPAPPGSSPTDTPAAANVTPPAGAPPAGIVPGPAGAAPATPEAMADATPGAGPPILPPQDGAAEAAAGAPAAPRQLGAYLGNNDVLLRFDPAAQAWVRLAPRSALVAGDRLLSLPTFRTHVVLDDVNTYLAGGAEIELAPPGAGSGDAPSRFGLAIPYGRVVLNSGLNGNRVDLMFGDQVRTVDIGPSSSLAIEVQRVFEPGSTAIREPAAAEVAWYLTSGTAAWEGGAIGAMQAEAPVVWTTAAGEDTAPQPIADLPEWVDREPVSDVERRARDTVAEALAPGEPVNLRLLELSDPTERGRRTEVRALAAESGSYVGQFDPAVKALADVTQKASWKTQIETLRQAVARDPESAKAIHAALVAHRGEEAADDLMEMLLGFDEQAIGTTRQQRSEGALLRLIRWMDDDDLTYRILASYNVNQITGTNYLGNYRPDQSAQQRQRALKHYYDRLDRGELGPKVSRTREAASAGASRGEE